MNARQDANEPDETLANKAIKFISTATPATLAGLGAAFAVVIYLILGQLGLLLIGIATGVVGFVAFEARHPEVARAVQGESGLDVLERLGIELSKAGVHDPENKEDDEAAVLRSFDDFQPQVREALSGLVDATIRDYIKWWYTPIIPSDHSFPLAVRKTLTSYLLSISNRLCRKRPADMFLDFLTNGSSMVIVFMSELAAAFADVPPDSKLSATDAVYNYLAANPDSRLANLLNQRQQSVKFRMVAEDLLEFLDRNSYNCDPARTFLREIIANTVLENTLQTWSKAEWINGWIVYLLEAGEPDISQAIDVGMQTGPDANQNIFVDLDGNVGNVGIAKPLRLSTDADKSRRKEPLSHKKKLSKADEEMEEAMEEMKRMNEMIAEEEARRKRQSVSLEPKQRTSQSLDASSSDAGSQKPILTPEESSPTSHRSAERPSSFRTSTDDVSSRSEVIPTPATPQSAVDAASPVSSPKGTHGFTSFDQIVPPATRDSSDDEPPKKLPLTLHNASFTLHDDSPADKSRIRSKPTWDYLIQVEPSSASYPGWMIVRRYSDFETLHEILKRIATISGATAFTELHKDLPNWRMHTRESLRGELERYVRDACWYQSLAESEGMKRFLEKSQGHTHSNSKSFGWDVVGKNMLDVLTIGPKGAMEGGKTIVGGVSGVLGQIPGLGRRATASLDLTANRAPISTPPRMESMPRMESLKSPVRSERGSLDSQRSSIISTQPGKIAPMERRPSYQSQGDSEGDMSRIGRLERMESAPGSTRPSREHSRAPSLAPLRSPSMPNLDFAKFPTPTDEMPYEQDTRISEARPPPSSSEDQLTGHQNTPAQTSGGASASNSKKGPMKPTKQYAQLSEQETRVAVELLFAVINEMYTLSSAWNIRRTLLTAAKSFLLRPGNPSLLTVQSLMQSSVLDANTSDAGIAAHLRKVRENAMPTEQERAAWPAELSEEEKAKLAAKARRLLIRSGVPAALMGVMGQSATGEALGRLFDCLQIEEVARGLLFGLLLQMMRVITH
ncbi:PXA domain-containing protein [Stachybotrys elegans]|uniref:PXA domain-containing protein n=1 Tax=Stachybotrys elegans TaxID=80388 RepID=A0A8K0T099_9HYPO|nr:PXA domain-containing protein [Stachybotrys elegans]